MWSFLSWDKDFGFDSKWTCPTLKYTGNYYSGASVEGIGMCIPINAVKPLLDRVLSGEIQALPPQEDQPEEETAKDLTDKPRLGVTIYNVNTSSRAAQEGKIPDGVFIEVEKGGPADKAGLKNGDIIVDIDDTVITDTAQLLSSDFS